jgi:hypothetical protein
MGRVVMLGVIFYAMLAQAQVLRAQTPSSSTPVDQGQLEAWRQEWFAYERELRVWCTKHLPAMVESCLQQEMAKYGVSPAFFSNLRTMTPKSEDIPLAVSRSSATPPQSLQSTKTENLRSKKQEKSAKQLLTQSEGLCQQFGELMYTVASGRDSGVPLSSMLQALRKSDTNYPGGLPLLRWVEESALQVYEQIWLTPSRTQQATEVKCLRMMKDTTQLKRSDRY